MRKIIQITATPPVAVRMPLRFNVRKFEPSIFALCNDGSVWVLQIQTDPGSSYFSHWEELPEIPQ